MLAQTSLEVSSSVFEVIKHNIWFSLYTLGICKVPKKVKKVEGRIEQRKEINQIKLHVKEVNESGLKTKVAHKRRT